jgi:hypothetical protein
MAFVPFDPQTAKSFADQTLVLLFEHRNKLRSEARADIVQGLIENGKAPPVDETAVNHYVGRTEAGRDLQHSIDMMLDLSKTCELAMESGATSVILTAAEVYLAAKAAKLFKKVDPS